MSTHHIIRSIDDPRNTFAPTQVPCPHCGAAVRYAPSAYIVRCPLCHWQVTLLAGEGWEFLQAITGMSRTDPALFLREVARRSSDVAQPPQVVGVRAGEATKQRVIAATPEAPWDTLIRLGEQARDLNGVSVTPIAQGPDYLRFRVDSQRRAGGFSVEAYSVKVGDGHITCGCAHNAERAPAHPAPCAHIGAVYLWLLEHRHAAPAIPTTQERAAAAYSDLFGEVA